MKQISRTGQFKHDVKRIVQAGKSVEKLKKMIEQITTGESLDEKYRDHFLLGSYKGMRECHIEPDWLLIYKRTKDELILIRTGSHSELFR